MKIERFLQLQILTIAEEKYPESIETKEIIESIGIKDISKLLANIAYLKEHELIESIDVSTFNGTWYADVTITSKGIDFITPDGGLSAELNKVKVQLDGETLDSLRTIMQLGIDKSDLPEEEKNVLKKKLAEAGSGALQDLTKEGLVQIFKLLPQILLGGSII